MQINGVDVIQDFIPVGRHNRPGYKLTPQWITIHDTANSNKGADALSHAVYLKGDAAANQPVSWHFTVDDKHIVQHLPLDEVAWHAGDGGTGPGNRTSLAVEICQNSDGNRAKAEGNAVALVAWLLHTLHLPISAVVQHNKWSGKNCPNIIRARQNGWDIFLRGVQVQLDVLAKQAGVPPTGTPILGPAQATVEQAQAWARERGAHQRFIDIAPVYWKYGQLTGIRPEVLYAQAAKETAFGRYGGAVSPSQNNWAGIKIRNPLADRPEDHETFATPEEGVRAHFNHIAAYVGKEPIGTPHARYHVVKSISWAGTIRTVEELGTRWAPASNYGESIVRDYLNPLLNFKYEDDVDYKNLYEKAQSKLNQIEMILKS